MIEQHPIAETGTIPAFEQIIFGMVTVFGRGNKVFFNFKNPGSKFKFGGKTEGALLTFAKRLETMRISPMRGPADQAESSLTPLDLNVDIPSAIVLAVPSNSNMQFSGSPADVTRKDDAPDSAYSDLRYMRLRDGQPPVLETAALLAAKPLYFCQATDGQLWPRFQHAHRHCPRNPRRQAAVIAIADRPRGAQSRWGRVLSFPSYSQLN